MTAPPRQPSLALVTDAAARPPPAEPVAAPPRVDLADLAALVARVLDLARVGIASRAHAATAEDPFDAAAAEADLQTVAALPERLALRDEVIAEALAREAAWTRTPTAAEFRALDRIKGAFTVDARWVARDAGGRRLTAAEVADLLGAGGDAP